MDKWNIIAYTLYIVSIVCLVICIPFLGFSDVSQLCGGIAIGLYGVGVLTFLSGLIITAIKRRAK